MKNNSDMFSNFLKETHDKDYFLLLSLQIGMIMSCRCLFGTFLMIFVVLRSEMKGEQSINHKEGFKEHNELFCEPNDKF